MVIACVLVLVLAAVGVVLLKRRGMIKPPVFTESNGSLGFDNAMYSKANDAIKLDTDA